MYDPLYARLPDFTNATGIAVDIAYQADHPTLNAHLAGLQTIPYDLVSTHTKYAPSQTAFLAPLAGHFAPHELDDFAPRLLDLASIDGTLYGLPRNVDLRLLHYRTDLIAQPPPSWDALLDLARAVNRPPRLYGFLFPGMESGLFGTVYELAEMGGAELFPPDLTPQIENAGGRWALNFLKTCYSEGLTPPEIVEWHYDKVHDCFRDGKAAMVGDWPGYYGDYRDPITSSVYDRFAVVRYPVGPTGRSLVYVGSHTFALTKQGIESADAQALLKFLVAPEQQLLEARHGAVPVRQSTMRTVQAEAAPVARTRWETLEDALTGVVIPPKFARYPEVEEVLWRTVQAAMVGQISVDAALNQMTRQIRSIVSPD
ncbi:MAG: extracellular solute-binding protein [Anaerolineales bacterium]|nr:extracellular solute-binding protein [Anaerolineales bacterium]